MAMQTQMQTMQQQNQLHQQQQQQQAMVDFFTALTNRSPSSPPSHGTELSGRKLDERHFRRVPIHDGKMPWKEWRTHFLTAVRESVPQLADCLVRIETLEFPIPVSMDLQDVNPLWELSPLLASRLTGLTRGVSFSMVESTEGNGIEAWRLLSKKYNPTTHARCAQLVFDIMSFRISKSGDVLASLVKWEAEIASLQRDHQEVLSDKLKIGFLLNVLPHN